MGEPSQVQQEAAQSLLTAYETHTPIEPLTADHPELTVEDAYAIQLEQVKRWTADGRTIVGHKVGLTSAAMQKQLGVTEPDFGHLLADFVYGEHEPIPAGRFLQPRVEPEIAFVLGAPLSGPGVTVTEAIAAVDHVVPALEVVDSRVADWRITLPDTIADNASSGGYVLGSTPTLLHEVDLRLVGCNFYRNGNVVGTGAGGAVLGSPITSLVWLANTLGRLGTTLEAGEVILPGSLTSMSPVAPGDTFTAIFAGLGSVTARFARD